MASLFDKNSQFPFKISRSKIDLFFECPRCFYLEARYGISRPRGFPFTLNNAVDTLLKKEFDIHRAKGEPHPMMRQYGISAIPFSHAMIEEWRNAYVGIRYFHKPTNLLVFGAVDDIWVNEKEELIVVDYKATSTASEITLDDGADYKEGYKRQVEIYQWLLRNNGFKVSNTAYFVYVNAKKDREAFDGKLEFDVNILPYEGNDKWIEPKLKEIKECLESDKIPEPSPKCEFCPYCQKVNEKINNILPQNI